MSITTLPTEYMITALPLDHREASLFAVWVQWRGDDQYRISRDHRMSPNSVLDVDGEWVWEPRGSERTSENTARIRFDLNTALRMAHEAAPKVTVNGRTTDEVLARQA